MSKKLLNLCLTMLFSVVSTAAWALSEVNGVYQIGSADDFRAFAALVNEDGNVTANAVLTADIDLGMEMTMIGVVNESDRNGDQSKAYQGTFNGQGHTIKINWFPTTPHSAVFSHVGWRAIIENLKVEGTFTTTKAAKFAAGIGGHVRGTIRNCYADISIIHAGDDGTHGGIAGTATNGTIIENCLVKLVIGDETHNTTKDCGGVIGWADSKVNIANCLVVSDGSVMDLSDGASRNICRNDGNVLGRVNLETYNADNYKNRATPFCINNYVTVNWDIQNKNLKGVEVVPLEDLADGRICYQLNNDQSKINWVQNIGTDPFPVPAPFGSGRVYASGPTDCDGKSENVLTYSNSGSDQADKHFYDAYGICTVCGCFNFNYFDLDDPTKFEASTRSILLGSKADIDMAEGWNRVVNGFKLHMKMKDDITYIADPGKFIFNTSDWTEGDFNGDGHALTIEMTDMGSEAALFPQRHYGSVENLIMHGKIETNGMHWGSISNDSYERLVRNVYSDINFTSTKTGDNTGGGFFGMIRSAKDIENCIYAGTITLPGGTSSCACVGGFAGWTHAKSAFTNCAFLGNIYGAGDQCAQSSTENSGNVARNYGNVVSNNVYVANPIKGKDIKDSDKYIYYDNVDGIANGELAFLLNGKVQGLERFFQRIGQDNEPMPVPIEGGLVYANADSYLCNGTPVNAFYQNTPVGEPQFDPHNFDEIGLCQNVVGVDPLTGEDILCGHVQEDFMTPAADGWYEIETPEQFLWWSNWASTHLDASARLMADIDLADYNSEDVLLDSLIKENGEDYLKFKYATKRFAQVGSEYKPFYGCFDGQRHIISNLHIFLPGKRGTGLISVMNSQPDNNLGSRGLTDDQARAAEGVYVKDVVLDETCTIFGGGYTGIVGMASPWAGHINISGCMNLGDVWVNGGTNGSGIYGCAMGSVCRATINACGMIGDIYVTNDTRTENGSFSGWLGNYAEVTNCFGLGKVEKPDPNRSFARHPGGAYNNGTVIVKNCYALNGVGIKQVDDGDKTEDVAFVTKDELETGSVTWKANGYQFKNPVWYQTLPDDTYPYPFDTHAVVIFAADQYFSIITDDDLADAISTIQSFENDKISSVIATQSVIDDCKAKIDNLENATTTDALSDALDEVYAAKDSVSANAAVYDEYMKKCAEVLAYINNPETKPTGSLGLSLEYYLTEADEPSDDNPLGTYIYIKETHEATAEEIKAETKRVAQWLLKAVAEDYKEGSDISTLIPNSDFSQKDKEWTNAFSSGYGETTNDEGVTVRGVEAWNRTGDQYQTLKDMKPGYYLIGTNAAFRPSNNRYSYNYAAGIYANGIFNYFPVVIEDYVAVEDTVDGGNCNLHVKSAYDLAIYDDFYTTSGEDVSIMGYAVHGETGMAIAAKVGRYPVYTIAKVAENGELTIGIKNPGTKYGSDWTGWSALKVIYCGDDDEEVNKALDQVIENMSARATTILDEYEMYIDYENAAAGPNYPQELKEQLTVALESVNAATTIEKKDNLVATFSRIFQEIYAGKQAYIEMHNVYKDLVALSDPRDNLSLLTKDEAGNIVEKMDEKGIAVKVFTDAENDAVQAVLNDLEPAYEEGSYSTEEALSAKDDVLKDQTLSNLLPARDENGYYLVGTTKQFVAFRAIANDYNSSAKAKLTADIDMDSIAMMPIGHNKGENAVYIYRGEFDGQGHALNNLYIDEQFFTGSHVGDPATLFYEVKGAVKNLKVTGDYVNTSKAKFMGGLTRWASDGATIDNCDIAVVMHSFIEGDGTHGGVVGVAGKSTINNCLVNVTMIGESENPTFQCGGVSGWKDADGPTINNTLIISQYQNITKGENGNVIGRNGYTANNVFYAERSNPGFDTGGTLATDEQLASGEIAWKLNGSTGENAHWFQTIGAEANPHLFGGDVVYFYAGEYVNDKPNPQLNAFAYNLNAKLLDTKVDVNFSLNAEAEDVQVKFYDGQTLVYTTAATADAEFAAGENTISVPVSELGGKDPLTLTYEVIVKGKGSKEARKMGDSYKFNSPYGLAVNNNPASKGFGQVLITETRPLENPSGMFSTGKPGALFAFDAGFQPVGSFYGGLDIANENPLVLPGDYQLDLKDVRFTNDGRLFVARAAGLTSSSVYELNPDNLNEAWKPVFKGGELEEATGITFVGDDEQNRPAVGLAFEGEGDDLKMYVLGVQGGVEELAPTAFNCATYDLGTATEWTTAPSSYVEALDGKYAAIPTHIGIHEDGRGGLWFMQNPATVSEETPVIKHFNANGVEDYSETTNRTNSGKIAISTGGKYIALPQGGRVDIYETDYVPMANGKIFLTQRFTVGTENNITGLAFDYANNLYVASSNSKTLSRYTIPGINQDNIVVTPGLKITKGLKGDVDEDGRVNLTDALLILDAMAEGNTAAKFDINGDQKVNLTDFLTILDIMAEQ